MRNELPPNTRLRRPYRQRSAPRNRHRQPLVAVQQQGQGLGSILKFEKKVIKNPLVKKLGKVVWSDKVLFNTNYKK